MSAALPSPAPDRRHAALSVGQRLFLGLLPSLLAVALVVGLAYYGQYAHTVPPAVVVVAAALAVASLVVTWLNARYVGRRVARLAGPMTPAAPRAGGRSADASGGANGEEDELDRIETVVDRLGSALSASEAERARRDAAAAAALREQGTLLSATVHDAIAQLDAVRLPLHILLENRFGELNENQEELLRDARAAADAMDEALRRLGEVADADRGALHVQPELVQVNDVLRAVLPLARAAAGQRGARLEDSLAPGLPRVRADRARLAEALTLLVRAAAAGAGPQRPLTVASERVPPGGVVVVTVAPMPSREVLADRLVRAQGGRIEAGSDGGVRVVLGA